MECFYIVTVAWVFSVCLHEYGHAWTADRGGDYTVREKGYLTLNPLNYAHPVYSLLLPVIFVFLGGIGLPGGAVYINDHLLRSRAWRTYVSLAGPLMNVFVVILIGLLFRLDIVPEDSKNLAAISLAFLAQLEISSILLCLLPIPPLDGFRALAPWLPDDWGERGLQWSNVGLFSVFILLWHVDSLSLLFWKAVFVCCDVVGVNPLLGYEGYRAFRFWEHPSS